MELLLTSIRELRNELNLLQTCNYEKELDRSDRRQLNKHRRHNGSATENDTTSEHRQRTTQATTGWYLDGDDLRRGVRTDLIVVHGTLDALQRANSSSIHLLLSAASISLL